MRVIPARLGPWLFPGFLLGFRVVNGYRVGGLGSLGLCNFGLCLWGSFAVLVHRSCTLQEALQ